MLLDFLGDRMLIRQDGAELPPVKATTNGSNLGRLDWLSYKLSGLIGTYIQFEWTGTDGRRTTYWLNKKSLRERTINSIPANLPFALTQRREIKAKFDVFMSTPTPENLQALVLKTCQIASNNDQLIGLQEYFPEGRRITDPVFLAFALRNALSMRSLFRLQFLFSKGTVTPDMLDNAILLAASERDLLILRFLLSEGRTVSQHTLDSAILTAADGSDPTILQFLLSEGRTVSQHTLDTAALNVIGQGYLSPMLACLLSNGRMMSPEARERGLEVAAANFRWNPLFFDSVVGLVGNIDQALRNRLVAINPDISFPPVAAGALYLTFEDVAAHPTTYLDRIYTDGFPSSIIIMGTPAIDAGGPMKEFVTTLVGSLKSTGAIALSEKGLPMVRRTLDGTPTEDDKNQLAKMGRLYSQIDEKNGHRVDKILLGHLFPSQFFDLVKIDLGEGTPEDKLKLAAACVKATDPAYIQTANLILDPSEANKTAYQEAMGLDEVGEQEMHDAKEAIQGYLDAAEAFARGVTPEFKAKILTTDSASLMVALQGEPVSKERLLASLVVTSNISGLIQKVEWLREAIGSADVPWMERFVKTVTGQQTLSVGTRIQLVVSPRNAFEIHTCFNSLEMPEAEMTKDDFLAALNSTLEGGYNVG